MKELYSAKKRTPQWVLDHLPQRKLEKMYKHLQQINLIANDSGLWDFQRSGFFKQSQAFEKKVRKAADKGVYEKLVEKSMKKVQRKRK